MKNDPPKLSPSNDISPLYIHNLSLNKIINSNEITSITPCDYNLIDDANPYPVRICIYNIIII